MQLKYRLTLKSDVVINQKAATEGHQQTCDFVPGSNILGIVAGHYEDFGADAFTVFHSGKVRFGDAHRAASDKRSFKIPNVFFYEKGHEVWERTVVRYAYKEKDNEQMKQCRSGFYAINGNELKPAKVSTSFAIKSAYDNQSRKSLDKAMYGYQSMNKDQDFFFSVDIDDDVPETVITKINDYIKGAHCIGRSRTAQYGLVDIKDEPSFLVEKSDMAPVSINGRKYVMVYADGRLIFHDKESGNPIYQPDAVDHLVFPDGAFVDWNLSQMRTFQYAPWNYKRQARDCDRTGIEKGSVLAVDVTDIQGSIERLPKYVGSYQNEGFGAVIYNPRFLEFKPDGESAYRIETPQYNGIRGSETIDGLATPLTKYINLQKRLDDGDYDTYVNVLNFSDKYNGIFRKAKFKSQFGAIRGIAMATSVDSMIENNVTEYISKGIKKDDWKGDCQKALVEFMSDNKDNIRAALVLLCSEMAKDIK